MRTANENLLVFDNAPVTRSLATTKVLKPIWLGQAVDFCVQLTWTGVPAGYFTIQASADGGEPTASREIQQSNGVENWTDIKGSKIVVSAAGDAMWNYENVGYAWVRVAYTATGTGTSPELATAKIFTKGV